MYAALHSLWPTAWEKLNTILEGVFQMAPVKAGKYEYRPFSLVSLRQRLGYTQAGMAQMLGVPPNTLSRWEIGATNPDAESLAAIYSIGMKKGIAPNFFQKRHAVPKTPKDRSRLLVFWVFRDWLHLPGMVARQDRLIRQYIHNTCPKASHQLYKAFVASPLASVTDQLESLGWRVWKLDAEDMEDEVVQDARSDCGHEPGTTILVLITQGDSFGELVHELSEKNVDIRLIPSEASKLQDFCGLFPRSNGQISRVPSTTMVAARMPD